MGTSLTFSGQDVDVQLDDQILTLVGATTETGAEPVLVPRADIAAVDLTPATLLAFGTLVIRTRGGDEHTVRFARDHQEHFESLEAIIRP